MGSNKGVGVHQSYKDEAKNGCDVLFRVKIKGRSMLVEGIPLHMSLKIFKSLAEFDLKELQDYVKEHNVCSPDPKTLTFTPIIFEAEKSKLEYYMLKIEGLPKKYKDLYDKYDKVGNVYKNFMTHVTIDKEMYDDLKKNGLKPEEIEFSHLILEHGAGNTLHDFEKSEKAPTNVFGEQPYGKHELSAEIIRETIDMHKDLRKNHVKARSLKGDDMRRYMEDNVGLDDDIAKRHGDRLKHHFGKSEEKIKYAWANGIRETYKKYKE